MNTLKQAMHLTNLSQWLALPRPASENVAWQNGKWITVEQMREDVAHLYATLTAFVAKAGKVDSPVRWALCFDNSYAFTVALLAVLHTGGVPVLMGSNQERVLQERRELFDAIVTDLSFKLDCTILHFKSQSQTERVIDNRDGDYMSLPSINESALVILYTSGSTGEPKEVVKPVRCLDAEVRWTAQLWRPLLKETVILSTVSHQHQYGLTFKVMLPMSLGIPFVAHASEYQEQMLQIQTELNKVALISSPAFLKRLDPNLPQLPQCQFVLSAGGKLDREDAQLAQNWLNVPVHEIYGSTETGVLAWRSSDDAYSMWRKFEGVDLAFNSTLNRWVACSELIGEAEGVVLDDRLELDKINPTHFTLHGRYDRIVKLEEKRISLTEVEKRIEDFDDFQEAVVFPIEQGKRKIIAAVVVPRSKQGRINEALQSVSEAGKPPRQLTQRWRKELMQTLEPIAVPRLWQVVDSIALNAQGKRDYDRLKQYFES